MQLLIKKKEKKIFSAVFLSSTFGNKKPGARSTTLQCPAEASTRRYFKTCHTMGTVPEMRETSVGNFSPAMGARNEVGIGL